jgi:RNA polymerase subunit RPABC4/transcription elongation factor Spt4
MLAETITIVPSAGLIVTVVGFAALAMYSNATKSRDENRSREAISAIRRCSLCNQIVASDASQCRHCSAPLVPTPVPDGALSASVCVSCGATLSAGETGCGNCGTTVRSQAPPRNTRTDVGSVAPMGGRCRVCGSATTPDARGCGICGTEFATELSATEAGTQRATGPQRISPPPPPAEVTNPPRWLADPLGRNELRYWDGNAWTSRVTNAGVEKMETT